jgi:TonB family protein
LGIGSAQVSLVLDRDIADLKILALWNETSGTLSLVLNSAIPPPSAPRRAHEKEPAAARGKETSPQILSQIQPTYTEPARSARLEGSVPLVIKVLKDGSVDPDIRVLSPIGLGLDEQAIAAVSRWKFKPGTNSAGSPVDAFLAIEILFQLK